MSTAVDTEAILQARAEILAQVVPPPPAPDTLRMVLTFRVGPSVFAIDPAFAHEVRETRNVARVPGRSGGVRGIINVRGRLVPLFDLGRVLNPAHRDDVVGGVVIVTSVAGEEIGLCVDAVENIRQVARQEIEPLPDGASYVDGVMPDGVVVFDGNALFAAVVGGETEEGSEVNSGGGMS